MLPSRSSSSCWIFTSSDIDRCSNICDSDVGQGPSRVNGYVDAEVKDSDHDSDVGDVANNVGIVLEVADHGDAGGGFEDTHIVFVNEVNAVDLGLDGEFYDQWALLPANARGDVEVNEMR